LRIFQWDAGFVLLGLRIFQWVAGFVLLGLRIFQWDAGFVLLGYIGIAVGDPIIKKGCWFGAHQMI
jgi:hypothetical protein